jgi:hypothetical protein
MRVTALSNGNCFFGQKCGNVRNGVYMFEGIWHMRVNVTI